MVPQLVATGSELGLEQRPATKDKTMPSKDVTIGLIKSESKQLYAPTDYRDRIVLRETFQKRPVLAATLDPSTINQAAQRLLTGANLDWIISGDNAANADSALDVDGGIALATAGSDNDQIILSPATAINSVAQSLFGTVEWEPEHAPRFEAIIELPSLADVLVHVGLGLTAALDLTTDDDQAKFQLSDEGSVSTTKWTRALSIGGTDTEVDLGVTPTADKTIRLGIEINTNRKAQFLIDGLKVGGQTDALTAGANLIPFLGIQALAGSAKTIKVREIIVSRLRTPYAA